MALLHQLEKPQETEPVSARPERKSMELPEQPEVQRASQLQVRQEQEPRRLWE
jgi:hypothetical protein